MWFPNNGWTHSPKKIEAIRDWPTPKCVRDVRAFGKLKQALINTVNLVYPQPGQIFIVDTDASDVACGAVLSVIVEGVERPVAFCSRVLNPAQRNYCLTRRELLAVVAAL